MTDIKSDIAKTRDNFDSTSPDKIIELVITMKPLFKSDEIREYLDKKLKDFASMNDSEKLKFSKQFKPYFDWYLDR